MTTEQETGKGAPGRRAVPKTGTRRSATGHQPKPRPRPDTRHEPEAKRSAAERTRAEAAGRRPADERARAEADGTAPAAGRSRGSAGGREAAGRVRGAAGRETGGRDAGERVRDAAGREVPAAERVRGASRRTPVVERVRAQAAGKRPAGGRSRAETAASRPAARRGPARRQRAPFVLLVVGLLCGGLVSLLLLNTMLAQDAITDATLRKEIAEARLQNEQIDQEYQRKTQPDVIADLAEKQGYDRDWGEVNSWSSAGDQASRVDTER
ncbi:hypothetical protein [Nonomuraea rubra]|uniref:Regulator of extracellular matrix RemA (YlzA/DUF370 family) n=1 Tax=Nonomuraea rubra TaxID=46180 RepID=A0A7X0P049_9ACTN|nr:hypothetical protein [Nonomuraea rubra]MBB6552845.1 regulator of extracellular matrix RemA (YlzA/DUF370 family) [Nonomuraea rubra]